jgi:hypothetical protein
MVRSPPESELLEYLRANGYKTYIVTGDLGQVGEIGVGPFPSLIARLSEPSRYLIAIRLDIHAEQRRRGDLEEGLHRQARDCFATLSLVCAFAGTTVSTVKVVETASAAFFIVCNVVMMALPAPFASRHRPALRRSTNSPVKPRLVHSTR